MVNIESNPLNGSSFMNDLRNKYMEKQTAVEYLFEQLWDAPKDKFVWQSILKKAKEIEKEQMLEVSKAGCFSTFEFEQYYNETFNTKEK